jgi:hypothetical protein
MALPALPDALALAQSFHLNHGAAQSLNIGSRRVILPKITPYAYPKGKRKNQNRRAVPLGDVTNYL